MSTTRKLIIAGLLAAVAVIAIGVIYFSFGHKENTMEQTRTETRNIPPIDASEPAHTETATFAMG